MESQTQINLYHQGVQLFKAQKDTEAQSLFEQCIEATDEHDFYFYSAHVYLLKICHEAQQFEKLLNLMQQYCNSYPEIEKIPALWILRGVWAKANLEYELAIDCFLKAINMVDEEDIQTFNVEIDPSESSWKPRLGLAEVYFTQERFNDAFPFFKQALKHLPEHEYLLTCTIKSGFRAGHYRQILPLLEQLEGTSMIPEDLHEPLKVAAYIFARQIKQAYEFDIESIANALWSNLNQLLSIDDFSIHVVMEFAFSLLHVNFIEDARRVILRLIELIPNHVLLWHNLAYSYFSQNDYVKAEQYYLEALNANPLFVYSRFDLGKVYVMQEQKDKAMIEFEQILEHEPGFKQAELAIKQLKEMQ